MEHMKLNEARRMAEQWLEDHRREDLEAAPDENTRRLLSTLYTRQRDSMDYLSLIRLDLGSPKKAAPAPAKPERWETILLHPLCEMLLAVLVLVFAALNLQLPAVLTSALMLSRTLLARTRTQKKERVIVAEVHEPYINREELERFLLRQSDRISMDVQSVSTQYAVAEIKAARGMENDFGNIFCALCEAQVDEPDNTDLAYPLSVARTNLFRLGYEPVDYSPETAAMFDVLPTEGEEQVRCPALRSRETGVVLKKGLVLRRY